MKPALGPLLVSSTLLLFACSSGDTTDAGPDGATRMDGAPPDAPHPVDGSTPDGFVPADLGPDAQPDAGAAPDADVPAPISAFCGALAQAVCDSATACGCAGVDPAVCRAHQQEHCEAPFHDPRLEAALTAGTIHFDSAAGDAVVASTRATPGCDSAATPIPVTLGQLTTFGGTFVGTVTDGAACTPVLDGDIAPNVCAPPDTCADDGTGAFRCTATLADLGASCTPTTTCADLASRAGTPTFAQCVSGTCRPLGADGAACGGDAECASGVCTGSQCEGPFAVGHACTVATQCPGVCNAGTCGGGLAGDACGTGAECKSASCGAGHCAGAVCAALAL